MIRFKKMDVIIDMNINEYGLKIGEIAFDHEVTPP